MKIRKILIAVIIALLFSSCKNVSTFYYQVYKTTPGENIELNENLLVFEDENCIVTYNLWAEGGNIGFRFFNKTKENIYLNLEESFFVLNGIANNYFKNRIYSSSKSLGITTASGVEANVVFTGINNYDLLQSNKVSSSNSAGLQTSSNYSVSFIEEKIICIPAITSKIIAEYKINDSVFRDCELLRYPTKKQLITKSFSKEQSPLVFSNRIAYSVGKDEELIRIENSFFVSEITNYPENEMFEYRKIKNCNEHNTYIKKYPKNSSSEKFFVKYRASNETQLH